MTVSAGLRNQRITIQTPTVVKGSLGDVSRSWATHAKAWAEVQTSGGNEFERAKLVHADLTLVIRCRWISGVTTNMRVLWKGQPLNILSAHDPRNRNDQLVIYCNEQLD